MAIGAISEDVVDEVSGAPSLNRNPDAPAGNAGTSSSLAEAADSRTTPVIGTCRRINRTVAAPFIPGICASTSSTWGWCALANSKAEGPVAGLADHDDLRRLVQHAADSGTNQHLVIRYSNGDPVGSTGP